ncbi:MAG: NAD(P)H-dependent oxidoreductase subunit E [Actinomycetota bacterium]
MDLHSTSATASDAERAAVDAVLGPPEDGWTGASRGDGDLRAARGGRAARERRHLLLPALHALQRGVGWVSEGGANYVATRLTVPPAEVFGVTSFYALLSTRPAAPTVLHVCDDVACAPHGAEELCAAAEVTLGPPGGEGPVAWRRSPCLGLCERAPAVFVQRAGVGATDDQVAPAGAALFASVPDAVAAAPAAASVPQAATDGGSLRLLRRVGLVDPASLADYRREGGYEGLARAIAIGPAATIEEVSAARLLGRGGAAFPTGTKWAAVAARPAGPRHVVCNADESEPGTFKDRVLMEGDPFAVVEALTIAAFAVGAERGFIYVRGEYPVAESRLRGAIDAARDAGLLGADVAGAGFAFDLEIRRGAGAYVCGEETALFESIEGHRGEPRNKPPFPVERGLFGRPTAVNNVETLANVPMILRDGAAAFAAVGTEGSTGTRLFCLSGCVAVPGVYEVPCGTSLRDLLARAGGVRGAATLRAVLLGGAAGGFVLPDALDVPLSFEGARAAGVTLGSGVVVALDASVDLDAVVRRIAAFFRDESCGQCVPCRVGTVRQEESLHRLARGGDPVRELALLADVAGVMRDASICGLGQTAASAVQSAIALGLVGATR